MNIELNKVCTTFILDLSGGIDKVWAGLQRKTRNQIRKSQKFGLEIKRDCKYIAPFMKIYSTHMRELGSLYIGDKFFKNLIKEFGDDCHIFLVEYDGKYISGEIVLSFGDTFYKAFGSSLKQYKHLCPTNFLWWEITKFACKNKYKYLDFGRTIKGCGTYNYKQQWGGEEKPLYHYFYTSSFFGDVAAGESGGKFSLIRAVWRRLPLWFVNWLGPKIIKHFLWI